MWFDQVLSNAFCRFPYNNTNNFTTATPIVTATATATAHTTANNANGNYYAYETRQDNCCDAAKSCIKQKSNNDINKEFAIIYRYLIEVSDNQGCMHNVKVQINNLLTRAGTTRPRSIVSGWSGTRATSGS